MRNLVHASFLGVFWALVFLIWPNWGFAGEFTITDTRISATEINAGESVFAEVDIAADSDVAERFECSSLISSTAASLTWVPVGCHSEILEPRKLRFFLKFSSPEVVQSGSYGFTLLRIRTSSTSTTILRFKSPISFSIKSANEPPAVLLEGFTFIDSTSQAISEIQWKHNLEVGLKANLKNLRAKDLAEARLFVSLRQSIYQESTPGEATPCSPLDYFSLWPALLYPKLSNAGYPGFSMLNAEVMETAEGITILAKGRIKSSSRSCGSPTGFRVDSLQIGSHFLTFDRFEVPNKELRLNP